ncbi:hypothetical protein NXV13_30235 [Bacteroides ovatus]|nr:hypothetical protein [Bacteroides ovatus]
MVVDVRPVQGDALFKSSYLTPLTDLADTHIERDWDYLQFFIDEAHKRELKVTVSATIFTARVYLLLKMVWRTVMIHGMEKLVWNIPKIRV